MRLLNEGRRSGRFLINDLKSPPHDMFGECRSHLGCLANFLFQAFSCRSHHFSRLNAQIENQVCLRATHTRGDFFGCSSDDKIWIPSDYNPRKIRLGENVTMVTYIRWKLDPKDHVKLVVSVISHSMPLVISLVFPSWLNHFDVPQV